MLSLPGAAQGCWRRACETKHDAYEAEGPSSKAKEKRVESLREGGGGGGLRIHWFALNRTKSKFLMVVVAMQPSKWAGNLRGRKDAHGHLHFKRISSKYHIAYLQDGHARVARVG